MFINQKNKNNIFQFFFLVILCKKQKKLKSTKISSLGNMLNKGILENNIIKTIKILKT